MCSITHLQHASQPVQHAARRGGLQVAPPGAQHRHQLQQPHAACGMGFRALRSAWFAPRRCSGDGSRPPPQRRACLIIFVVQYTVKAISARRRTGAGPAVLVPSGAGHTHRLRRRAHPRTASERARGCQATAGRHHLSRSTAAAARRGRCPRPPAAVPRPRGEAARLPPQLPQLWGVASSLQQLPAAVPAPPRARRRGRRRGSWARCHRRCCRSCAAPPAAAPWLRGAAP